MNVGDLLHGWCPIVCELKNWVAFKKKKKKKLSVGVELRTGGDSHRSEKPGWSAGDMRNGQKKYKVLLLVFELVQRQQNDY